MFCDEGVLLNLHISGPFLSMEADFASLIIRQKYET
jgi:hypothetical protein